MREKVIAMLRASKWYSNLYDECEGYPPMLEAKSDEELLELFAKHV